MMTVKLPVKKCYYFIKVIVLIGFVVCVLSLFEFWRGGGRNIAAQDVEDESELERQVRRDEARIVPGLGEGGDAAVLVGDQLKKGQLSEKKYAMNVYLSDRISYNRTLKDYRNPACARVHYEAELPSASVVIVFHNEPYSALLRTVWSVLNSVRRDLPHYRRARGHTPHETHLYLKEIILVDDNSTLPELRDRLSHYVRTRMPPQLVRILRLPERGGLTRARLAGAKLATGDVLVFLDGHCEVDTDWLRPLLARIRQRARTVVVPIIDAIDSATFLYSTQDYATFQVGGFTFAGHFTWIEVPEREKKRRGSDISPTWSPTMAGGLFAISRDYFWQLGAYDEQMAGWGGENLELSFRIWQCGGTLETVPCSRVGHVFRSFHPYGLPASSDTHGVNTARMAEVWMDDYKELFYLHRPDLRNNPKIGDVTHRKVLREKLQCKSFGWYLSHVYPDKFVPVRDTIAFGRFRQPSAGLCLDTLQREGEGAELGLYPCHPTLQPSQYYSLSVRGELRDEETCAEVEFARESDQVPVRRRVVMMPCHGKRRSQRWRLLSSSRLQHVESRLCLAPSPDGDVAMATGCDAPPHTLVWEIDYNQQNQFALDKEHPTEQELKLRSLRPHNRVPRSVHRRGRGPRGRRGGPQFVLVVSRPGRPGHLHVRASCPHRPLHGNDSLMRDVLTALTRHRLQVENKHRLFVGDRVVDLRPATVVPAPAGPPPPTHKPMIIEDFVEIPDHHADGEDKPSPAHADTEGEETDEGEAVRSRDNNTVLVRAKSGHKRGPKSGPVFLKLNTNLSLHLDDQLFWKRDSHPSSRENMSLLGTLSPYRPIPTLPPSDTDDDQLSDTPDTPDRKSDDESDRNTDTETDKKTDIELDMNTTPNVDPDRKSDVESDRKSDVESDRRSDDESDRKTDVESDRLSDSGNSIDVSEDYYDDRR